MTRSLVLWLPDWPVTAAFGTDAPTEPCAVMHDNTVVACSAAAREQGVRRGQRRRLAQSLCPRLRFLPADPGRDERAFLAVLRMLEKQVPGVLLLRPGLAAFRARGPARYYGGEEESARFLLRALAAQGHPDARAGVADGLFTAEQAARCALTAEQSAKHADNFLIVPAGQSAAFLAPLPVRALGDEDLASLLIRLGVHSLGQFAALTEADVHARLGDRGVRLRSLAAGADSRRIAPRLPEAELAREVEFGTPLEQADQIGFAVRQTADAVIEALAVASLVCTEVRIDLADDRGGVITRNWLHPSCFEATDLVDRVRWQLEGLAAENSDDARAGITGVRITPVQTDQAGNHQPGLFGQGREERLHHGVSRVQALLGHRAVLTGTVAGGRLLADRQHFTAWGDRVVPARPPERPWPGHLPPPLPSEVFTPPRPVSVRGDAEACVEIDERGILSTPPAFIEQTAVRSWAGPWPVRDRVWDVERARLVHRLQLVDERQRAWVVLCEDGQWWAEGIYR